jgi:hypothetical protein
MEAGRAASQEGEIDFSLHFDEVGFRGIINV